MNNSGTTTGSSARRNAVEIEVMWTPAAAHAGKASSAAAAFAIAAMMFKVKVLWLVAKARKRKISRQIFLFPPNF